MSVRTSSCEVKSSQLSLFGPRTGMAAEVISRPSRGSIPRRGARTLRDLCQFYRGYGYRRMTPHRMAVYEPSGQFVCCVGTPRQVVREIDLDIKRRVA